jgi:hypothetical protein
LDIDGETGPAGGRFGVEELGRGDVEGGGQPVDERQTGLPTAVLDEGEIGGLLAHLLPELLQGEAPGPTEVAQSLPEDEDVQSCRGDGNYSLRRGYTESFPDVTTIWCLRAGTSAQIMGS